MDERKVDETVTPKNSRKRRFSEVSLLARQFLLILGKNLLLQIRRPVGTIFELIVPIAAVVVIMVFRLAIPGFRPEDKCFVTFESDPLSIPDQFTLFYTPTNNTNVAEIMSIINQSESITIEPEENYVNVIRNTSCNRPFDTCSCFVGGAAAVVFDRVEEDTIEYTIRLRHEATPLGTWRTDFTAPRVQPTGPRISPNFYLNEGFMQLQKLIDEAIIEYKTNEPFSLNVEARQLPYPPYRDDTFLRVIDFILPLFVILSFIYSAGIFVKELVLEKETRIRETMKMMGLSNWILVVTWFLKQTLFFTIPVIIMTIILKAGRVFPFSDGFLIFLYLLLFVISGIAFCFLISVWFSSARIGLFAGFIIWFVAYFPHLFVARDYETLSLGAKLGVCLISNSCVGFGVTVLSILELRQEGVTFENFAQAVSIDDDFHMGWVCLMLAIDTFIYMLLYWYIDAVKPGRYGVPKPLYFFLLPSYWCGTSCHSPCGRKKKDVDTPFNDMTYDGLAHEEEPRGLPVGISIERLSKRYSGNIIFNRKKGSKLAVDRLSLNMYKGQITVLLGHNGAGKTTTMSILTGLFPPTSGAAYINGLSVVEDIDLIRRNLGICPQHNVLFDRLTVREHLYFFAMLKGYPTHKLKGEVNGMIEDLLLTDKSKIQSQKLSGGMKRKLSVGIALVGGSEVVILDEPTSGMDPYARRATWDLLNKHKEGRTMLLTTHFMDEADLLGDRIAIMAEGKLRCSGSSLFLKSRYGVGYHLVVVKESHCNSEDVIALVTQMVTGSEKVTDVGAELSFILPSHSTNQFPGLFDTLDGRKKQLGISSFGISVTTMEEVFIKVKEGTDETLQSRLQRQASKKVSHPNGGLEENTNQLEKPTLTGYNIIETTLSTEDGESEVQNAQIVFHNPAPDDSDDEDVIPKVRPSVLEFSENAGRSTSPVYGTFPTSQTILNTGLVHWIQQFCAMFLKRMYHSLRFWASIIWQLIIPMGFILWGLILGVTLTGINSDDELRTLSLTNSAPDKDNITFFWSNDESSFNTIYLTPANASAIGATNLINYTPEVQNIRDAVSNSDNVADCCNYNYQILDKFCATRNTSNISDTCNNDGFSYFNCKSCLSSCTAQTEHLQTCTTPSYRDIDGDTIVSPSDFCPDPPTVSLSDLYSDPDPTGPLDSWNTFVAEKLLMDSADLEANAYFLRIQGGFVFHKTESVYSACACANSADTCEALLSMPVVPMPMPMPPLPPCDSNLTDVGSCAKNVTSISWSDMFDGTINECIRSNDACSSDPVVCKAAPDITTDDTTVTVWYNNQPYHMPPAALNAFYNLYIKQTFPNFTISVNNHPLPRGLESEIDDAQSEFLGFTISSTGVFGLSFLFASFIIFVVQEKDSKAKHLQFVSGVQASSYWLATFTWDLINCLIPCIIALILFAAFNIDGYNGENLGAIFLLLLFSCWSAVPINYIFSFVFSNALVAFSLMVVFFYFGSLIFQVVIFVLQVSDIEVEQLHHIFLLHPTYALAIGLSDMYTNQGVREACTQSEQARVICDSRGIEYADSIFEFSRPAIGHILVYMTFEGIFFMLLTILIERRFFMGEIQNLLCRRKNGSFNNGVAPSFTEMDSDVADETTKVQEKNSFTEDDAVTIKGLVKEYRGTCSCINDDRKLAVDGIHLLIPTGECFGLLGVNGAGKTTTFKMLTGDIYPTGGTAYIGGYDVRTSLRQVQQRVGYCPQFDALIERLTGRETLTMFARLRGIPEKEIKLAVQTEIDRLDLRPHADKRCGTYSGGNKRKLSTAIALVGSPLILFLDEPTTGMDPATRRFLWDTLIGVIREGRSVVLTSHSMEECEALCTRLAIMVNGQFKCLGSTQHLKSKFGSGYTLTMKVMPQPQTEDFAFKRSSSVRMSQRQRSPQHQPANADPFGVSAACNFVTTNFPGSRLLEQHQGSVTYQVPDEGVSWSSLFSTIDSHRDSLGIIDYSVSQTTLDQVFINFAKEQEEETL